MEGQKIFYPFINFWSEGSAPPQDILDSTLITE
jgi:hypothetical protein